VSGERRGLDGVRVLELGQMVAAPYATKLMADLGADVVKVEPPEGDAARRRGPFRGAPDPEASGLYLYLNTNKRSVGADLATTEGVERALDLAAEADIVVTDHTLGSGGGPGYDELAAVRDGLVVCSITPFGLTGPYSGYRAEEITTVHGGGWGYLTPGASTRPELPPLKPHGHQAAFASGIAAATAALAAFDKAERTGVGEHLDVSQMAHVAAMLEAAFIGYTYTGEVATRLGIRLINPWKILDVADGSIFVVAVEQDQWERLVELMGTPEWATLDIFADRDSRNAAEDVLHLYLAEWAAPHTVAELFHGGQARRIAFAPVHTMEQMDHDPHLAERGFIVELDQPGLGPLRRPGPPSRLGAPWWALRSPAPRLGEHEGFAPRAEAPAPVVASGGPPDATATASRPLDGITVADFSWVWAGPYCTLHLAHLGADVVKIESGERLDLGRRLRIASEGMLDDPDACGYFNQWAQGKRSLALDLGHAEGLAVARRLALASDVVVSNFAYGVMERYGLGYEELAAERPDLIYAQISGYGATGPYRTYTGYGPTTGPLSGLSSLTGYEGLGPSEVGISIGDPSAGIAAAYAIVAAVVARRRTGEGQHIDTSLWEATAVNVGEGWMEYALTGTTPERIGNHDPLMSPHAVYRAAGEDDWVTIACATEDEWRALVSVVDPGLGADPRFADAAARKRHEADLDARIEAWTSTRDRWEVTAALQAVGVAAFPSMSAADLAADEHLRQRGFHETLDHPVVGRRMHAGIPWRTAHAANGVMRPAPCLGQHTREVLRERLGLSDEDVDGLAAKGALR
jgi:crotonobetainyl-CoA:carnitine CoA-transferase CaiB-like acyl-CoA transferase